MRELEADVVVIGSGAGGGTVAQRLAPLAERGRRVIVVEQGPRFRDEEFDGNELHMARALYADAGGFLNEEGTLTLAFGRAYGGSTVVYTGTSLPPPERVVREWAVPGLDHVDLLERVRRYVRENNVHLLPDEEINQNNRLFVEGAQAAGFKAHQFPVNVKGCLGSSLCNLGCPNGAKQGTHKVQLPRAEASGVEVVTRAEALRIGSRTVTVRVSASDGRARGAPSEWEPGTYEIRARVIVVAGGAVGSSALLLRSGLASELPVLGAGLTVHPALILVGEHDHEVSNDVGHPKSFYVDRAEEEGFVLETCTYFPFVTAKSLTGFGAPHESFLRAFPRLQMILVLACDRALDANRVTVARNGHPSVHYRFTPEVTERLAAANRAAAHIFFGAGALRVHAPLADPHVLDAAAERHVDQRVRASNFQAGRCSVSAAHLQGGCRMGTDTSDSVTDAWGRVHGHPWLRVADSSLFPDAIQINPYLTVMSLADRVAEGVLADS
jgi:choline dehydrogenase-like flavoprotein